MRKSVSLNAHAYRNKTTRDRNKYFTGKATADTTKLTMGNGIIRGSSLSRSSVVVVPTGERENGDGERAQCSKQGNCGLGSPSTASFSSGNSGFTGAATTLGATEVTNPEESASCSSCPG